MSSLYTVDLVDDELGQRIVVTTIGDGDDPDVQTTNLSPSGLKLFRGALEHLVAHIAMTRPADPPAEEEEG